MNKIREAKKLCQDKDSFENFNKGLNLFQTLCVNQIFEFGTRIEAIKALFEIAPDEANDKLARCRQALMFYTDDSLIAERDFLVNVVKQHDINSHERLMIAIDLYNNHFIEVCYGCFKELCLDDSVLPKQKIESVRYLLCSGTEENREIAKNTLLNIVNESAFTSSFKYETITSFNSKIGLATLYNMRKLNVMYDEELLYSLQIAFFSDKTNEVRYRLLSGQHLLQMSLKMEDAGVITEKEKENIANEILNIAENYTHTDTNEQYNCRADAADIVSRLGNSEQKLRALDIIKQLGTEQEKGFGESTVYSNAQNVHDEDIQKCINDFIEDLITSNLEKELESYQNIHTAITQYIHNLKLESRQSYKAFKSLSRISMDTATFTSYNITSSTLLIHIWTYISSFDKKNVGIRKTLKKRLVEELIDMADTCSSGHSGRLANVLNGYGLELKIGWKDQIIANANARMQARIRDIEDEELRGQIACGTLDDADEDDRKEYVTFIEKNIPELRKELFEEFVEEGYIGKEEFNSYFDIAAAAFLK